MDLILATSNLHKIREFRFFLKSYPHLELYSFRDFPNYVPPEEIGSTFEENAILKALEAAKHMGKWAIADDSGLVVPALQGAPGVFSARYSGSEATDKENRAKLLAQMSSLEGLARSAYFECVVVVASPDAVVKVVRGLCEGWITTKEKGANGFGYDSLFIKNGYKDTFAELDESVKNQISHRAKAFSKLADYFSSEGNRER